MFAAGGGIVVVFKHRYLSLSWILLYARRLGDEYMLSMIIMGAFVCIYKPAV